MKWVVPEGGDHRFGGISAADTSALEWALRIGETFGHPVLAVTVGPAEAEAALRDALACGAQAAVRVDTGDEDLTTASSAVVAQHIARAVLHARATVTGATGNTSQPTISVVCCGDYSLDRGTGSVPAFLAHLLGAQQALGLVQLQVQVQVQVHDQAQAQGPMLTGLRRLDGGRRERLAVSAPAVISVEGATATLRRASVAATLRAKQAVIHTVGYTPTAPEASSASEPAVQRRAYRPRARELAAPVGDRALDRVQQVLSGTSASGAGSGAGAGDAGTGAHRTTEVLEPAAAARRIVDALRDWGYIQP
jgi:electron transfer flavoprotein beta subunit